MHAYNKLRRELSTLGIWSDRLARVTVRSAWILPVYGYWFSWTKTIVVGRFTVSHLMDWYSGNPKVSQIDILRHEFGHAILDGNRRLVRALGFSDVFRPEVYAKGITHVTPYCETSKDEDFCETFMLFVKHKGRRPSSFRGVAIRKKWHFVRRLVRSLRLGLVK